MQDSNASKLTGFRASRLGSGVIPKSSGHLRPDGATRPALGTVAAYSEPLSGYVSLQRLESDGRAEVSVGVGAAELTLERLVVIKRFAAAENSSGASELDLELELGAALDHPNLTRTLRVEGIGKDACRYSVTEYLDGITLDELLAWAAARASSMPAVAVSRILLSLLDAVQQGQRGAPSEAGRRLCELPIAAHDVFVTYDGRVKLLGFKPIRRSSSAGAEPAVDALLSRHRAAGLRQLVTRHAQAAWASNLTALIGGVPAGARPLELQAYGRDELTRFMQGVHPVRRARLAGRLVAAFARWRAEPG